MGGKDMAVRVLVSLVDRMTGGLNSLQNKLEAFGKKTQDIGKRMSLMLTTPIVGMGGSILRTAATFEQSINRIRAVTGAGADEIEKMSRLARELGRSTAFSASEAAEAMHFLAKTGFDTNQIIAATPGLLDLALAGDTDLGRAADIASNVLTAMRLPADEMGRVADVLAEAASSANVDLNMLGDTMKYVAPIAAEAGMSLEEAAAMAGKLGDAGIQGSMAGTVMRQMINQLSAGTPRAIAMLDQLGVITQDAQGNLRSLPAILADIEAGMSGMGSADRLAALRSIFDTRAMSGAGGLLESLSTGGLDELIDKLENAEGRAREMADVQMEGLTGAMRELTSAFEDFQLTIAENGLLQWATESVEALTDWVRSLSEAEKSWIKWALILAGGLAVMGPVLFSIGLMASALAALSWPIALAILGIAALVAAGVYLYQNWDEISAHLEKNWGDMADGVGRQWDGLVETVSGGTDMISSLLKGDLDGAVEGAKRMFDGFGEIAAGAMDTTVGAVRGVIRSFDDLFDTDIDGWITDTGSAVDSWIEDTAASLEKWATRSLEALKRGGRDMKTWLSEIDLSELVANFMQAGVEAGEAIVQAIKDAFDALMEWFAGLPGRIIAAIGSIDLGSIIQWPAPPQWWQRIFGGGGEEAAPAHRAGGGPVTKGQPYIVGEKGWELFVPGESGRIIPHHEAAGLGGSKGFAPMGASARQEISGRIVVEAAEGARIREVHSDNPDVSLELDRGMVVGRA